MLISDLLFLTELLAWLIPIVIKEQFFVLQEEDAPKKSRQTRLEKVQVCSSIFAV